jgi:hypothetical protein
LLYIHLFPNAIEIWNRGWLHNEAPSLAKMFDLLQSKWHDGPNFRGSDLTASFNSLLHGKPDSALWNLIPISEKDFGYAPSKIVNRPELCDDLCANIIPWIAVAQGMMSAYFSEIV